MARKRKGKRKQKKKKKREKVNRLERDLKTAAGTLRRSEAVRAQVCESREKKKGGAKKEIRERRRRKREGGEKESEREKKRKKYTYRHTRIYIYIYGELVTPGSPRPGLDNRDVFRAKNRPGTRVSPRSLALWLRLVGWLGCVRARAGHAEVNGALPRFFGPENVAAWVSAWIPRSMHSWLGGTVTFNRHVNR